MLAIKRLAMLLSLPMKTIVIASVLNACKVAGGKRALAKLLGVTYGQVYQWSIGVRGVPVRYCQAIVELTEGQVKLQDLRPTDWHLVWPLPDNSVIESLHTIDYDPIEGNCS